MTLKKQREKVKALEAKRDAAIQRAETAASKHQASADKYAVELAELEATMRDTRFDLIRDNIDLFITLTDPCREDRQCEEHGPCTACQLEYLKKYGEWEHENTKLDIELYR